MATFNVRVYYPGILYPERFEIDDWDMFPSKVPKGRKARKEIEEILSDRTPYIEIRIGYELSWRFREVAQKSHFLGYLHTRDNRALNVYRIPLGILNPNVIVRTVNGITIFKSGENYFPVYDALLVIPSHRHLFEPDYIVKVTKL